MIRTMIDLLEGPDSAWSVPSFVKAAGLIRSIAVIQHTYRPDSVDMYFDEPLWLGLLDFALGLGRDNEVRIVDRGAAVDRDWRRGTAQEPESIDEVDADGFLSEWNSSKDPDRDPPEFIVVRQAENLVLCIATEYWTRIGGPWPYADSYTYSIFSRSDVAAAVTEFLRSAESAHGWELQCLSIDLAPRR